MIKQTLQKMPFLTTFNTYESSAEDFSGPGVGKCCVAVLSAETSLLSAGLSLPDGSYTASPATQLFGWLLSSSLYLTEVSVTIERWENRNHDLRLGIYMMSSMCMKQLH